MKLLYRSYIVMLLISVASIIFIHLTTRNFSRNMPEIPELQDGDIICRRGRSPESRIVFLSDYKSNFSHVGIIKKEYGIPYVIHVVPGENKKHPEYVRKEKLNDFLSPEKASTFGFYRTDFSKTECEKAANIAEGFYQSKLTFDTNYNLNTDDQLYCTELVFKAYQGAIQHKLNLNTTHLNLIFGNINVVMPGNILENTHFFKINKH